MCSSRNRPARKAGSSASCSSPARRTSKRNFISPCCSTAPRRARSSWQHRRRRGHRGSRRETRRKRSSRRTIDPAVGMMPYQARKIAAALGLKGDLLGQCAKLVARRLQNLVGMRRVDGRNQSALHHRDRTARKHCPPSMRKSSFDDNALYRHKNIQEMRDLAEEAPLEIEASKFNLNYIKLDGNIACLVNGAGLAMATMDIIQHFGGKPGELPRCRRRREQGTGHRGVQNHSQRPEREGNPRQHFRRHHGLQRHRHRHRRSGEGNGI